MLYAPQLLQMDTRDSRASEQAQWTMHLLELGNLTSIPGTHVKVD